MFFDTSTKLSGFVGWCLFCQMLLPLHIFFQLGMKSRAQSRILRKSRFESRGRNRDSVRFRPSLFSLTPRYQFARDKVHMFAFAFNRSPAAALADHTLSLSIGAVSRLRTIHILNFASSEQMIANALNWRILERRCFVDRRVWNTLRLVTRVVSRKESHLLPIWLS